MKTIRHTNPQQWVRDHVAVMPDGCWVWLGAVDGHRYGLVSLWGPRRTTIRAHRFAYQAFRGPVPDGLVLDHVVCDQTICANPWHVEPVTQRENTLRSATAITAINARKTHCKHGHELSGENLRIYVRLDGRIQRSCKTCSRRVRREMASRRRASA